MVYMEWGLGGWDRLRGIVRGRGSCLYVEDNMGTVS